MSNTLLPPKDYWVKRSEQNLITQEQKAEVYNAKLKTAYEKAKNNIEKELSIFYQRYASNNNVSYVEAQKLLSKSEINKFKDSLDEYIKLAKLYLIEPDYIKKLENISIRAKIRRIEALKINIENEIEMLSSNHESNTSNLLTDNYSDNYYRTIWTVQTGLQFGVEFNKLNTIAIEKIIKTPWLGENYSDRIYKDKNKLVRTLETELQQSFIKGDSGQNTAKRLYRRLDISYNNAVRLVRTESNHISNEATAQGYINSGVISEYEYLATLDTRTSHICQHLDGQVFKLSERQVGINYPPALPNCRSTTIPYFPDETAIERIARGTNGKTYNIAGNITYNEWYKKYIV